MNEETAGSPSSSAPSPSAGPDSSAAASPPRQIFEAGAARVRLVPGGLDLGDRVVPLHAGSVHYWRHDPMEWKACLRAVQRMGFSLVDTYVPWGVHERVDGTFDFGERDPRLDIIKFLELCDELGLPVILRPGPHINAELTYFGLPERILWDRACQARSPKGNPVMLPMLPRAFPVPSYASEVFFAETAKWFDEVGKRLAHLRWPDGPLVMLQVDNEGAMYFRDGAYDQDYHPDALALFRASLAKKYPTAEALEEVYGVREVEGVEPPTRFEGEKADDLAPHLDWVEHQETVLATALDRMAAMLRSAGLDGLPTMHNLPFGQETTALNAARIGRGIDLVALDYYHQASPHDRRVIARRTSELATRCEALHVPAYAAEMGGGFPPFFPPLSENDSIFTLLTALAYGLRGFNLYMAVERDRWIGAPVDPHGLRRPFAKFYERLLPALGRLSFATLRRRTPVSLVTPRSLRRLSRVLHAFGPASGALFAVLGAGPRERCLEDDLDIGNAVTLESFAFLRTFEEALEHRGVPFADIGGEDLALIHPTATGKKTPKRWIIVATPAGLKPSLLQELVRAADEGTKVTLGPRFPERDQALRRLPAHPDTGKIHVIETDDFSPAEADLLVGRAIDELGLPTIACDPGNVTATIHEDEGGLPRAVFVINPSDVDCVARVSVPGITLCSDVLEGTNHPTRGGVLEVRMPPKTTRFFAVEER
jgi:beta-galactosidase